MSTNNSTTGGKMAQSECAATYGIDEGKILEKLFVLQLAIIF
jgi:hypothetical protein